VVGVEVVEAQELIPPIHLSPGYALSLSTVQLLGIVLIALLTWTNTRGLDWGKLIQNVFTTTKTGALVALIAVGLIFGWNPQAVGDNLGDLWTARGAAPLAPGLDATTGYGIFIALCRAGGIAVFGGRRNNITFTAGEVKDPRRNILLRSPGTTIVITPTAREHRVSVTLPSTPSTRPQTVATATRAIFRPGRDDHGGRDHDPTFATTG
jgi:APA family basic amino acid/polyamine antiporter